MLYRMIFFLYTCMHAIVNFCSLHFLGHVFSGVTKRCDNKGDNFWDAHVNGGLRYANVILRRNSFISLAGIFTGTSCGRPSYVIRDIYVHH